MIIDHQSIPYRNFIKQLYPLKSLHSTNNKSEYFDFVNNSKKYLSINHEELYKRIYLIQLQGFLHLMIYKILFINLYY